MTPRCVLIGNSHLSALRRGADLLVRRGESLLAARTLEFLQLGEAQSPPIVRTERAGAFADSRHQRLRSIGLWFSRGHRR